MRKDRSIGSFLASQNRKVNVTADEKANTFVIDLLDELYRFLLSKGIQCPQLIPDKYTNSNPLKLKKFYEPSEALLVHYMANEDLIAIVVKERAPLLIDTCITEKGLRYLLSEKI